MAIISSSTSTHFGSNLTPDEYADFHIKRKSASTMDEMQKAKFGEILTSSSPKWLGHGVKVLSIGSGTGDFDVEIIKQLQRLGVKIQKYVCIEPIADHIRPLAKNLLTVLDPHQVEIHASTFEEVNFDDRFHFIHNVHVIHWMEEPVKALKKMECLLEKSGASVTVLQSDKGMPRVYKALMPGLKGNLNGSLVAEDLFARTQREGLDYELDYVPAHLDVTAVIRGETLGREILQFVLSSKLTDEQFERALPFIEGIARKIEEGRLVIDEPFAFLVKRSDSPRETK